MSVGELIHNQFFMHGTVFLIATDQDGNIKQVEKTRNFILNQGRELIYHGMFSGAGYTMRYIGVGGTINWATADKSLGGGGTNEFSDIGGSGAATGRGTAAFAQAGGSGGVTASLEATIQFTVSHTALIVGLFVASSPTNNINSVVAEATFDSIVLASTDKLTVRWVFSMDVKQA